jgi:tight adherence protein B
MSTARLPHFLVILIVACVAAWTLALNANAAEADTVAITGVDVTAAPDVTLTVAIEGDHATELDENAFALLVSGKERDATLTGLPSDPMQVELVIDTSGSMRGAPLDAAKEAAATLVDQLPASVRVGVIGFGDAPYEVVAPTNDHGAASAAIASLQSDGETALYDAVLAAAGTLTLERRAVVLLTDGKDTASSGTLDQAVAALGAAPTSFFSVVLDTPEIDLAAADAFAAAAGGKVFRAAEPAALVAVYDAIAGRLSASYQLSFRATQSGSTGIVVRVDVDGQTRSAETRAVVPVAGAVVTDKPPALSVATAPQAEVASTPTGFASTWGKWIGIMSLVVALGIATFVFVTRQRRERQVADRRLRRAARGDAVSAFKEQASMFAERSLDRSGKRTGLERALENAGMNVRAGEFLLLAGTAAFAAFALGLLFGGLFLALLLAGAVVFGTRWYVSRHAERRRKRFGDQLEQTLPLLAGSLRAGFGIMQGLDAVARESASPTSDEFRRLVAEIRLGRDLGESLEAMAQRMGNEDFAWVVQAIEIHRQVGGDLAQVLDNVHATIRDRNQVRRQVSALSAEGRLSAQILFILPLGMGLYISATNPNYMAELTGTTFGKGMLVGGALLMVLGGFWMRRIVRPVF